MDCNETLDVERLIAEIQAYLAVVDFFRSEGCEPTWRSPGGTSRRRDV
jgi:hypothetical protein